jgi:hypothetical protein
LIPPYVAGKTVHELLSFEHASVVLSSPSFLHFVTVLAIDVCGRTVDIVKIVSEIGSTPHAELDHRQPGAFASQALSLKIAGQIKLLHCPGDCRSSGAVDASQYEGYASSAKFDLEVQKLTLHEQ